MSMRTQLPSKQSIAIPADADSYYCQQQRVAAVGLTLADKYRNNLSRTIVTSCFSHKIGAKYVHRDRGHTVSLTAEGEGVALGVGAYLGGQRAVLLMQSSGGDNCITMLSLMNTCDFPFLLLMTMDGELGEFNPWQVRIRCCCRVMVPI